MNRTVAAICAAFVAAGTSAAQAQAYPAKPIRFVVAFGPGSATDAVARFVGNHVSKATGQPVVVDNRGGASGFIAAEMVARAPADGYTVLVTTQTTQAANASLFRKLPYDPVKDFAPVSPVSRGALVLVAAKDFPADSVAALVALAKKNPGKYTFASGNASSRAGGDLFRAVAGVDILHVPYKSAPQALTDLVGGQIHLMWADVHTGMGQVRAGRVKPLATTGARRLRTAPDVPTMAEQGVPYELYAWTGIYLPAGAPAAIVARLNELVAAAIKSDPAYFEASGSEPFPMSPAEFAAFQAREIALWAKIVKLAGIEPE
ncbi:MAG: Bug family tripartite tricarboxylate transporter substrate binding protein [Betaproteobacteria bacterium]